MLTIQSYSIQICLQVCERGRIVTGVLLCLTVGVYLTCSTILVEVSKSTSCILPPQLNLNLDPTSRPSIPLMLFVSITGFTQSQHASCLIQHEFVLSKSQKTVHFFASLVNSVGVTLILMTISANMMQLMTSFLDDSVLEPQSLVGYSLLFVLLGYLCTILSFMIHDTVVNIVQYVLSSGTISTDTLQTPSIFSSMHVEFGKRVCGINSTSSCFGKFY